MALEPQIKEIEIKKNKKLEDSKLIINVSLNSNGEKISKVLFSKSLISIDKTVVMKGTVLVEGVLNSFALVKMENGEVQELKTTTAFSHNIQNAKIEENTQAFVEPKLLSAENLVVNDTSLNFVQEVELGLFVCEKQTVKYVEELNKANQKIGTITYQNVTNHKIENFEVNTEIDMPSSISKVLSCESEAILKNTTCMKDILTINGEICTNLIYLTSDDTPKLKSQTYVSDFSQEVLLDGVDEKESAVVCLNTKSNDYSVVGEMNSKGVLELKNKISASIVTRKNCEITAIVDAFCPRKELKLECCGFQHEQIVFNKVFMEKIDGSYVLSGDEQIDKVVFCSKGETKVSNIIKQQDEIVIKGEIEVFVVYVLDDENSSMQSINISIPFETKTVCDEELCEDKVFVDVKIKEVEARNKRAKEIDVLAELCTQVVALCDKNDMVVSGVELGEDRKQNLCSMGIYVVDDANSCWDVAKKLLVNPDVLMEQNKDLSFPINKPTQIIVYRQKTLNN